MVTKIYGSTPYRQTPLGGSTNDQDSKKAAEKPNRRTFLKIASVGTGLASVGAARALAAEPIKNETSKSGKAPPSPQEVFDKLVEKKIIPNDSRIQAHVRETLENAALKNPKSPLGFYNGIDWLKSSGLVSESQFNDFLMAPDYEKVEIAVAKLSNHLNVKKLPREDVEKEALKFLDYFRSARKEHDREQLATLSLR